MSIVGSPVADPTHHELGVDPQPGAQGWDSDDSPFFRFRLAAELSFEVPTGFGPTSTTKDDPRLTSHRPQTSAPRPKSWLRRLATPHRVAALDLGRCAVGLRSIWGQFGVDLAIPWAPATGVAAALCALANPCFGDPVSCSGHTINCADPMGGGAYGLRRPAWLLAVIAAVGSPASIPCTDTMSIREPMGAAGSHGMRCSHWRRGDCMVSGDPRGACSEPMGCRDPADPGSVAGFEPLPRKASSADIGAGEGRRHPRPARQSDEGTSIERRIGPSSGHPSWCLVTL